MPDRVLASASVAEGLIVEVEREDGTSVLWQADSDEVSVLEEVSEVDGVDDWAGRVAVWMRGGVRSVVVAVEDRDDGVSWACAEKASVAAKSSDCWRSFIVVKRRGFLAICRIRCPAGESFNEWREQRPWSWGKW